MARGYAKWLDKNEVFGQKLCIIEQVAASDILDNVSKYLKFRTLAYVLKALIFSLFN